MHQSSQWSNVQGILALFPRSLELIRQCSQPTAPNTTCPTLPPLLSHLCPTLPPLLSHPCATLWTKSWCVSIMSQAGTLQPNWACNAGLEIAITDCLDRIYQSDQGVVIYICSISSGPFMHGAFISCCIIDHCAAKCIVTLVNYRKWVL